MIGNFSQVRIAGVDEAGRGPWAGPVFAAAVILDESKPISGLADSKKLSPSKREALYNLIIQSALSWSVAQASVEEIDQLNILQASLLAMRRAVDGLSVQPDQVLIDGNQVPSLAIPALAIVKGDSKIPAISAASILAKVERDQLMKNYQQYYPQYSFQSHKGYGTRQHLTEIKLHGVLPLHRKTFKPIKTILQS